MIHIFKLPEMKIKTEHKSQAHNNNHTMEYTKIVN